MSAMDFIQAIVLGFVQGFGEFLPISSSGHLYLFQVWMGLEPSVGLEVILHVATLGAVCVYFWKDIWRLVSGWCLLVSGKANNVEKEQGMIAWKLGVATLCTVVLALLIEPYFEDLITVSLVGITLIATAFFIWGAEAFRPKKEKVFTWTNAFILGCVQAIALFPGISRSGVTVACLVLLGLHRKKAAEYSFLLAIPTILGAFVFTLFGESIVIHWSVPLLVSGVLAFVSALVAIQWMMKLIEGKWVYFAWYCLAVGVGVLIWNFF